MKTINCLFLFIFLALVSRSQKVNDDAMFSLRAGFGYNLPVATGVLATNFNNGATEGIYGSWGKGFIPSLDFSVRMCRDFRGVVGVGTLFGPEIKSSFYSGTENLSTDRSTKSKLWMPALITLGGRYDIRWWDCDQNDYEDNPCHHFIPYMGCGVGVGLGTTVKNTVYTIQKTATNSTITDIKSTTTFLPAFDLYGEVGVKYMISDRLSVFLDTRLSSISLMPSKQKITSEIVNGQDVTSGLTVSQKETDFKKKVPAGTSSPDEPSIQLAEKFPASGLAINCGISWNFGLGGKVLFGGPGAGVPKGGQKPGGDNKTKEKQKEAEAAVAACSDCPKTELILETNNEGKNFPKENIIETNSGPYGKSGLASVDIPAYNAVCEKCKSSGLSCCCRLKSLTVKLIFQITYDTAALNKGVWLNTNKDSKEYEHTRKGKNLPEKLANKEDWKKVDKKSVEVHERQHCSDMKVIAKELIESYLKNTPVENCVCSKSGEDDCQKKWYNLILQYGQNLKDALFDQMDKISKKENDDYTKGDLEKKAREVQANELNNRPK